MAIGLALLAKKLFKRRRKKKRAQRRGSVPVVRRRYMSDGKSFVTDLVGRTAPGAQKAQFPYELPVIETSVSLDDPTKNALYITAGTIAVGMIGSQIIKRSTHG